MRSRRMRNGVKYAHFLFKAAGLCLALAAGDPGSARAQAVDPAEVGTILGSGFNLTAFLDSQIWKGSLYKLASAETKKLDASNKDWNETNPEWRRIFDVVRSDLADDLAARATLDYDIAIASNLQRRDADAIMAYYALPAGVRYQSFQNRTNTLLFSLLTPKDIFAPTAPTLPLLSVGPAESQRLVELVTMSRVFLFLKTLTAVNADKTGGDFTGFMTSGALALRGPELESLERDYHADLPNVEAFNDSSAEQHFVAAMGNATQSMAMRQTPLQIGLPAILAKRE